MPIDYLHALIVCGFFTVWALIGQFTVARPSKTMVVPHDCGRALL